METLKGFPNLPAMVRAEQGSAAPHAVMETLKGFPNLPAMVRAEQGSAAPHATHDLGLRLRRRPAKSSAAQAQRSEAERLLSIPSEQPELVVLCPELLPPLEPPVL
jgi:hypothetical protein